jgi:hypothetical protein
MTMKKIIKEELTPEQERKILEEVIEQVKGRDLFPERTAEAKRAVERILKGMEEGRIPKDLFSKNR